MVNYVGFMTVSEHIGTHLEGCVCGAYLFNHKSLRLCPVCAVTWVTGLVLPHALVVYLPGDSVHVCEWGLA